MPMAALIKIHDGMTTASFVKKNCTRHGEYFWIHHRRKKLEDILFYEDFFSQPQPQGDCTVYKMKTADIFS
jgi:hypothetical protein